MRIKQRQVLPCVDRQQSAAIKVYVTETIAENDILALAGMHGSFVKVAKGLSVTGHNLSTTAVGLAAFGASAGDIVSVLVPWKVIKNVNTTGIVTGRKLYLSDSVAGGLNVTQSYGGPVLGWCVVEHATEGVIWVKP